MHASPLPIPRKSRMRKRARTDLCGGRSVMIVPTATTIAEVAGMVVNVMLSSLAGAETYPLHKRLDQEP